MVLHFFQSITLILALCWLQSVNTRFWRGRSVPAQVTSGLLFGATAIVNMLDPIWLAPGVFIDARLAVLGMACVFGGPLAGCLAVSMAVAYRLELGGAGAVPGAAGMLITALLGFAYRHALSRRWVRGGAPQMLGFGFLIHLLALFLLLVLSGLAPVSVLILSMTLTLPVVTLMLALLLQDLQQRSQASSALEESEARMRAITHAIPDLLLVLDEDGRYLDIVSPVQHRHLLYDDAARLQGRRMHDVLPTAKADRLLAFVRQSLLSRTPEAIEYTLDIGATHRTFEGRAQALDINLDGRKAVVMVARDITAHKAAEAEIMQLAFFDPLTGLPNRRRLIDRLTQMQARSAQDGTFSALLCIDLDDFKKINDLRGSAAGDQMLQQVACRLESFTRETHSVARMGGDKFAVLLSGLSTVREQAHSAASLVAGQLLEALRAPYQLGPNVQFSSGSIGIVLFNETFSANELLQQADLAMYAAKDAGKNTWYFFVPAFQEAVNSRLRLEEEIRQGLLRGEFHVHYQPQFDERGHLAGAEALVRWQHPEHGLMIPGHFIGAAEQAGLLQQLDHWVLVEACHQLAAWSGHPVMGSVPVSVNISAVQLHQGDFSTQVMGVLAETGAPANLLMLELTESVLVRDMALAIAHMEALRVHGVRFALDDFGTGYSSLSYLQQLPLDELKIDQSFVRSLPADTGSLVIIRAITALAESFGFDVIAEGVETDAQHTLLASNGCRYFQGYLFAQPMPAEALTTLATTLPRNERHAAASGIRRR
ncbi:MULTISPECIES: EAL domain-containing protein [Microvirgula]|uniref:GGDEF domain-containing protein n=1 Tax=Microvirgula aerodenitrificans TaxID=57480 RepID=A0A2S0PDG1_9NEIS|nr:MULTISPECIES: EAL domain-containing protein [Microvirgula]AVY95385.1 GGDEF domain-containing protein [Microvirgula aerodenitrificans]RAS14794.1 PAS domain S-box-containing protein/diguanylate cyclase (GGDEF)-like protein [Microvirgula sp. AG722]